MKLVVGLGNVGKEYKNTRHNLGFSILDEYLGKVNWKIKMEAYIYKDEEKDVLFVKPMTYMNLSGLAVAKIVKYYKIAIKDILVIVDDLDLPVGSYKVKKNSSSGGHNGIKSIINELNTEEFGRLKIGIGKNPSIPTDKYVLGKFTKIEEELIKSNLPKYLKVIDLFINNDIDYTISNYKEDL